MIKISPNDTLIDILDKIDLNDDEEIILDFPIRHHILNNYISLKILKNQVGSKDIYILTKNKNSKKIGVPLGILYNLPKKLRTNISAKEEIMRHNYTFFEYFGLILRRYFGIFSRNNKSKYGDNNISYSLKTSGILIVIIGLLFSSGMLFFIFYFAISKTYIEIKPEINIKTYATNLRYIEDYDEGDTIFINEKLIPIKPISRDITITEIYNTTGVDLNNSKRASGEVEITNELFEDVSFKPNTRFQTSDGLVFDSEDWIAIPGSGYDENGNKITGKTKLKIYAKVYDDGGEIIGTRGNISSGELLTFPGLSLENRDKIYAQTTTDFTGGADNIVKIVGDSDIDKAKNDIQDKIKKEALKSLKDELQRDNEINLTAYDILSISGIIKYSDIAIETIPSEIEIGDILDDFSLKASMKISVYIYDKNKVMLALNKTINDGLLKGIDKLVLVDENSIRMDPVLYRNNEPSLEIKATTSINVGVSYDFGGVDSGYRDKLKNLTLGLPIEDAKKLLLDEGRIKSVEIKNTPFFLNNVSSNIYNISLDIDK